MANIVVQKDKKLITPPVRRGLLAGTFRNFLLDNGEVHEGVILMDDLLNAPQIWLINSVRKWIPATLVPAKQ